MKQRSNRQKFHLSTWQEVYFERGQTVLEALIEADVEINYSCGGMGTCATCRVFIEEGAEKFPERNEVELERAQDLNYAINERQSCQLEAIPDIIIRIP